LNRFFECTTDDDDDDYDDDELRAHAPPFESRHCFSLSCPAFPNRTITRRGSFWLNSDYAHEKQFPWKMPGAMTDYLVRFGRDLAPWSVIHPNGVQRFNRQSKYICRIIVRIHLLQFM